MTTRAKCQCSNSCNFTADESGYYLLHDPNRQDERARILTERAIAGGKAHGANRKAAAADEAASVDLRTIEGRRDAINRAARRVFDAGVDPAKLAAAIATLIKAALETDRVAVLEDENKELRAIIESHPELKRKLRAVP
jgi:hypothetical protein